MHVVKIISKGTLIEVIGVPLQEKAAPRLRPISQRHFIVHIVITEKTDAFIFTEKL